ncbi:MAG TPA: trypsin-like peptidase domain-containing protein [Candidatus Saccharimonadales bacterium]
METIQHNDQKTGFEPTNANPAASQSGGQFGPGHRSKPMRISAGARLRFLSVAALIIISMTAGFAGGYLGRGASDETQAVQKQQVVLKTQGQLISSIAKNVGASVVSVEVTSRTVPTSSFFGYQGATTEQSAGTGIILDKNGLIITNRHVVPSGATSVSVTLSDGTKYGNVQVIGRTAEADPLDIAFLKITDLKGKTLTPAAIGKSGDMKVGDSVVAIGNALGQFQNTVTTGIISGFGRSVSASDSSGSSSENLENLFQTDAAINEGNSGGPLVNLNGEVIGINTAIASSAQNIGFAIPIDDVAGIIRSVEEKGKLERPYIGVIFVPITADMAQQYNLGVSQGAYIPPSVMIGQDSIVGGGPAAKAGLKEGDIITKVDGRNVDQTHSLTSLISQHNVGDKIQVTVYRGGKTLNVDVTLSVAPTS